MDKRRQPYNPEEIPDIPSLENRGWEAMRQMLDEQMPQKEEGKKRVVPMYWRWMAAAVLLLVVGALSYRFLAGDEPNISNKNIAKTSHSDTSNSAVVANSNTTKTDTSNIKTQINNPDNSQENPISPANKKASQDIAGMDFGKRSFPKKDGKQSGQDNISDDSGFLANNSSSDRNAAGKKGVPVSGILLSNTSIAGKNKDAIAVATVSKNIPTGMETTPKKINMDFLGLVDSNRNQAIAKTNLNKENVEGSSRFRERLNQALWNDEKSDSVKQAEIAKTKKIQKDSQLVAHRREQLEKYFEEKEEKEKPKETNQKWIWLYWSIETRARTKETSPELLCTICPCIRP